jgi:hypothetical protein
VLLCCRAICSISFHAAPSLGGVAVALRHAVRARGRGTHCASRLLAAREMSERRQQSVSRRMSFGECRREYTHISALRAHVRTATLSEAATLSVVNDHTQCGGHSQCGERPHSVRWPTVWCPTTLSEVATFSVVATVSVVHDHTQ